MISEKLSQVYKLKGETKLQTQKHSLLLSCTTFYVTFYSQVAGWIVLLRALLFIQLWVISK
jgi:hypothetical protein